MSRDEILSKLGRYVARHCATPLKSARMQLERDLRGDVATCVAIAESVGQVGGCEHAEAQREQCHLQPFPQEEASF